MALSTPQILSYLALKGIGPKAILLLNKYVEENLISLGSADDMLDLINFCIDRKILSRIKEPFEFWDMDNAISQTKRMLEKSAKLGIKTISFNDAIFPDSLRKIVDSKGKSNAPLILHIKGNVDVLRMRHAFAIIGTREPTAAGVQAGLFFSEHIAKAGFNIVSGLALGCDTTAHQSIFINGRLSQNSPYRSHPSSRPSFVATITRRRSMLSKSSVLEICPSSSESASKSSIDANRIILSPAILSRNYHSSRNCCNLSANLPICSPSTNE